MPTTVPRRPSRRRGTIRWDRVGRVALLGTLLMILVLYVSPAKHWIQQSGTAATQRDELRDLTAENRELKRRVRSLRDHGILQAGSVLPPVRELAATLGVNRNTAVAAYRQAFRPSRPKNRVYRLNQRVPAPNSATGKSQARANGSVRDSPGASVTDSNGERRPAPPKFVTGGGRR